jgi:hypothetical protein
MRWRIANVEAIEQLISIILFLLLVLSNVDEDLRRRFLPLDMLMESVADFLLALFNCGEPGVYTSEIHRWILVLGRWILMESVWTMEIRRMVVEAPCREGHASSLDVTRDLLILLLLVVVKIPVLSLCTGSLLP